MLTYHTTYCKVYEKCKRARDADKPYIEVRAHRDSYRLYAYARHHGFACFPKVSGGSIIPWAATITRYIAGQNWCKAEVPVQGELPL